MGNRAGKYWIEQDRMGLDGPRNRTENNTYHAGQNWAWLDRTEDRTESRVRWDGMGWDKTRQDKTRQDKTRQDNIG